MVLGAKHIDVLGRQIIKYDCPCCGSPLQSPCRDRGLSDTCPDCQAVFTVPNPKGAIQPTKARETLTQSRDIFIACLLVALALGVAAVAWLCISWVLNHLLFCLLVATMATVVALIVAINALATPKKIQSLLLRLRIGPNCDSEEESLEQFGTAKNSEFRTSVDWKTLRGIEFEEWLQELFDYHEVSVETTRKSGDHGVDLIATCDLYRVAIEVKGWSGSVGNDPLIRVMGGQYAYDCDIACVITNSYFTSSAWDYVLRCSNNPKSIPLKLIDVEAMPTLINYGLESAIFEFDRRLEKRKV